MPRALRGRFEPLDHFVLGHLSILGPLSALGSPHAAKRFIGLAIVVRGKDRARIIELRHEHLMTSFLGSLLGPVSQAGVINITNRNAQIAHLLCGYATAGIFTPTFTVVQKIALTAIVDQAHNSN